MLKSCYFIILQHVGMKKLKILKKKFRFGLRKIFSPLKTFGYNFWTEGQIEKFIGIKNDPLVFLRGVSMKKSHFTPKWVFSFFHFGHFQKIPAAILLIFLTHSNWCTLALSTWEFISKRKFNIRRTVFPVGPVLRHSRSKNPEFQKIPTRKWGPNFKKPKNELNTHLIWNFRKKIQWVKIRQTVPHREVHIWT